MKQRIPTNQQHPNGDNNHNIKHKRINELILKHEELRMQVKDKQYSIANIFKKDEKELSQFFIRYRPLSYSHIDMKKNMQERFSELRLIKNVNKIYFGGYKDNQRQGEGVLIDDSKRIYEGSFEDNVKSGYGVEIYSNGNIYIGEFSGNKKHGLGQFFWFTLSPPAVESAKCVEFLNGKWWGGLPDGAGCHQKASGDIYKGQFKNGLKHGKGEESFDNGDSYNGQYVNGLPEGFGLYTWSDQSYYEGDFKQGLRNGHGIWRSYNGAEEYKGQYILDRKSGAGEYSWENGKFIYKGEFQNDEYHGYGELFYDAELKYKGQWAHGKKEMGQLRVSETPMNSVSTKRELFLSHTPKSRKLPSLSRLKAPNEFINHFTDKKDFSKPKKSFSRKKIHTEEIQTLHKLPLTLPITRSNKNLEDLSSNLTKLGKQRPHSLNRRMMRKNLIKNPEIPKFELVIRKCQRRNCACNIHIPIDSKVHLSGKKKGKKHLSTEPIHL